MWASAPQGSHPVYGIVQGRSEHTLQYIVQFIAHLAIVDRVSSARPRETAARRGCFVSYLGIAMPSRCATGASGRAFYLVRVQLSLSDRVVSIPAPFSLLLGPLCVRPAPFRYITRGTGGVTVLQNSPGAKAGGRAICR